MFKNSPFFHTTSAWLGIRVGFQPFMNGTVNNVQYGKPDGEPAVWSERGTRP
jgi:hypothetical protein